MKSLSWLALVIAVAGLLLIFTPVVSAHHEPSPGLDHTHDEPFIPKSAMVAVYAMAGIIVATSTWVFMDANRLGAGKRKVNGLNSLGPWGWLAVSISLWVLAFPLYIWVRGQLKG